MPRRVSRRGTRRIGSWIVASVTRSFPPTSIIANFFVFVRCASHSFWPGKRNPTDLSPALFTGPVTSAA